MEAPSTDYHTTLAAELANKVNEVNPFVSPQRQLVNYREATFSVLIRYVRGYHDREAPHYEKDINVVICTALENFDDFMEDMRRIFCGPEGEQCVLVNWSGGARELDRKIFVDKWNFPTVLRMLEARLCSDQVVVGPKELANYL